MPAAVPSQPGNWIVQHAAALRQREESRRQQVRAATQERRQIRAAEQSESESAETLENNRAIRADARALDNAEQRAEREHEQTGKQLVSSTSKRGRTRLVDVRTMFGR